MEHNLNSSQWSRNSIDCSASLLVMTSVSRIFVFGIADLLARNVRASWTRDVMHAAIIQLKHNAYPRRRTTAFLTILIKLVSSRVMPGILSEENAASAARKHLNTAPRNY